MLQTLVVVICMPFLFSGGILLAAVAGAHPLRVAIVALPVSVGGLIIWALSSLGVEAAVVGTLLLATTALSLTREGLGLREGMGQSPRD